MTLTFTEILGHDMELEVGASVEARWTSSGNHYSARATVERLNVKSVRVRLDEAIEGYPVGWSIVCPRPLAKTWSWNNCVRPIEERE
jgi:hypothetical protein